MKLNITKIKKLRIKLYYFYEKKNHTKRNCSKKIIKITKKWIKTFEKKMLRTIIKNFHKQYIIMINIEYINQIRIHRVNILNKENQLI